MKKIEDYVTSIPDFPEPGIIFRDITTVLQDADGLQLAIDSIQEKISEADPDVIVGLESRGFIFGMPVAYNLHKPFVLVRKKGKLPYTTISEKHSLEYGFSEIEIHIDAFKNENLEHTPKVLLIDDLIATGGTAYAATNLIQKGGATCVEACFIINLESLNGSKELEKIIPVFNVLDL